MLGRGVRLLINELIVSKPPWGGPPVPGWLSNAGSGTPRTFGQGQGEWRVLSVLASRSELGSPGRYLFIFQQNMLYAEQN